MGDFSNGNDAVILKNKADLAAIKGQSGQPGRILGVALSAGARARDLQAEREGRQGRQHLGCRHRRRLQDG